MKAANDEFAGMWYTVQRSTWDTFIIPSARHTAFCSWPSWKEAQAYTVDYLNQVLCERQYSAAYINAECGDPVLRLFENHPGNIQMEAEIRDYIQVLLGDIAESECWKDYALQRIQNDQDYACILFSAVLMLPTVML